MLGMGLRATQLQASVARKAANSRNLRVVRPAATPTARAAR